MAAAPHRASFPLRLQQILSWGRAVPPAIKLESETPPKVKAFIDRVINSPLHDIAIPLLGFRWEFNKGNLHHWRPLFIHFDTYFKTYISSRKDLILYDDIVEDDPLPKNTVLQILRVMQIVLENCQNKSSFTGLEHFKLLLASSDPEIVVAALETLAALVKINPSKLHQNGKLISCGAINSHLLSLAQGWGSKEEGLGLYSCVVANERNQQEGLCLFPADMEDKNDGVQHRLGSTLHFEYNLGVVQGSERTSERSKSSSLCMIHIPDLHLVEEDDWSILKQCIDKFKVPPEHRFALFTRIRYAHAFNSPKKFRLYSRISLLAFIVLVQSSDAHDELVSFFTNEPEYINELIRLVRSEDFVPGSIRALAMLALGAQLGAYTSSHERARILSGSSIISAGGNRMVLLSVLQKAILSLSNPNDTSSPLIVDALLQFFLLHVLSSSSAGTTIRGSGMVPPLLPLLQDNDPYHIHLVCLAVKTLQKLMEYSSPAISLFKDLGGIELLSQRLHVEVQRVISTADNASAMVTVDKVKLDEDHLYSQKCFIKSLLKALGSATYSPANPVHSQSSPDNFLPVSLSLVFHNVDKFGGDIYFSAVTVMSEIIHKDPTCFPGLKELGLPDAFLSSVTSGVIPSCKALICVPNGLGAICLNNRGLEAVKETLALRFLVDVFTSRKYMIPMNEAVVLLANAVEELLRHVQSLRSTGVDIIVEIIEKLSSSQVDKNKEPTDEGTNMETDVEGRDLVSVMDSSMDGINDDQFSHLSIFHVMVLVHRTMENSETSRLFVEKGGLQALLKLLLRPSITQSSGGMPIALHSTMVFKSFTQHHSTPLARAFCSSLREHLKNALRELVLVSSSFEPTKLEKGVIPSLFVVEFLLFLDSSKDNRWMNALLSEFGDASRDILEDIGRVHREVLWQISLFEEMKIETSTSSSPSANEPQQLDMAAGEIEENRFSSFRQCLDPLLRRRASGWNIESQVSDLIGIYHDISRAASDLQGVVVDQYPSSGLSSSSQDQPSSSSDANAGSKSEEDKKRSEYSSCYDMMRSLSYHINHLFMELGKAMLLMSRRDNSPVNLSPSVVSVASNVASIVLEHLNFNGHAIGSEREVTVTTKCRYLGKVVQFIDGILLDRPESCNPIIVNSFYCHGVILSILTTFEATSELLFAMNRSPASPMEMDIKTGKEEEETDSSWIYGPLSSCGALMDHLVTSSFVLSSSTRQLLEQPIFSGSVRFPQDAERFMKSLQSKVLKTVLPIWTHPQFAECSIELIGSVTSIMRHVYSGVEVKSTAGNVGARLDGPPPNENAISLIVEMGFSRARAEEALRQVGTNSVEIATDWLFSHPEEPKEDDELAQALAMSLGNSDASTQEESGNLNDLELEEETVQLPPVDEVLSSCLRLLQTKETLAFPVRDMLMTISSQNDGQNRVKVVTYLIDHVKHWVMASDLLKTTALSALFHVLALILHGDIAAREVAAKAGLVKVALNLICSWELEPKEHDMTEVPKWITSCFLSIDRMLQLDPKLPDVAELEVLKKDNSNIQVSVAIDEGRKKESASSSSIGILELEEQKQLLGICCKCIQKQLPSGTMHVIFQLCATLTKSHAAAISFLDSGGLHALLSLPTSSLFSGFSSVASTIIRHILEDPHTLQQAMELEIRHSLATAANRHANLRVTPHKFVQNLAFVIHRDPVVFLKAAQAVCQIEMVGDRPYVVLLKDREKENNREKEKNKSAEKDKAPGADGKVTSGDTASGALGSSQGEQPDLNTRSVKSHRKSPQCFVTVIEHLLDLVMSFVPPPRVEDQPDGVSCTAPSTKMDIDETTSKGKGKAVAVTPEESKLASQDTASFAKIGFILKFLTDVLLTYASSIQAVVRRDAELSSARGRMRTTSGVHDWGIFHHILQHFVPHAIKQKKEKKTDGDWRHKLATRANQFLVASSIRSAECRKRIFSDINSIFVDFINSSNGCKPPVFSMNAYVDLLNDILSARSPTGSSLSAESAVTFVEVGLVQSLSRTLQVLDLDHPDSAKTVTAIVKALEVVTKEHVHSLDLSAKGANSSKVSSEQNNMASSNRSQSLDTSSLPTAMVTDHRQTVNATQTSGSLDSVGDDMDHDRDLDGVFAREGEDEFMHEISEDRTSNENSASTMEIRFEVPRNAENNMANDNDDTDEDMSAEDDEDADEDEDEDEENNHLEEEDVPQISHPDTDHDDHEIDEEEFDEDLLEEEDEDEGGIVRLEEGINGINVFDHIEIFGGSNNLSGDTLRVMPLDIFSTRRQGRSTSIYNLLGRASDHGVLDHPHLDEPSILHLAHQRQPENLVEAAFSDRNHESNSSRFDAIFRSLRSGRNGHRFNMWLDDSPQRSGSAAPAVPESIEGLLISQLRRPTPEQPDDSSAPTIGSQEKDQTNHLHGSETESREEAPAEQHENNENVITPAVRSEINGSDSAGVAPPDGDSLQDVANASEHVREMQYERSDAVVRDVEAVSQASSGSGATLGESLRSLEVEIGSVEGHDDGDRHGASDRLPSGNIQTAARSRRSSGSVVPISSRDVSLECVSEVPHNSSQEADLNASEEGQQSGRPVDSDSIDPTFLEALPEDLRAEVLSSRQNQMTQTSNEQPQNDGDIDPEFLAALPPDIREEVLAQQRAQRLQQSQDLEGQPVEMDAVSIIATFPSEIREEVLLTSPDTLLATLTPALVAEANMLRERFAHRYHSGALFGMNSRNRRGESSRHGVIGSGLGRNASGDSSRQPNSKMIKMEGVPLVDKDALEALIRLLRVVQPLYKGQLQRLLLNLCAHQETRTFLVQILVDMLMLDLQGSSKKSIDVSESPFRLYGCHASITYSRPQSSDGVPPLVSRRVLETLTYLARNHPNVAKLLLYLEFPCPQTCHTEALDVRHGKAVLMGDGAEPKAFAIALLLTLLNRPLYMRSVAHLEQLLNLLEVVMINAADEINHVDKLEALSKKPSQPENKMENAQENVNVAELSGSKSNAEDSGKTCFDNRSKPHTVLQSLPQAELQLLCSLLARDGLSDNAYVLVAEVLKKIVDLAPFFCCHFITELARSMQNLTLCAMKELRLFEDTEKALLSTSSANGTAILRVLQALSSLVTTLQDKKDPGLLAEKDHLDALSQISEINTALDILWLELSNCINKIESLSEYASNLSPASANVATITAGVGPPLPVGTQNILPYIESFFVMCEKLHPGQSHAVQEVSTSDMEDASTSSGGQKSSGSHASLDEKHHSFVKFLERHRRLLNAFIRQNPGLLEKSFSLMLKIPRLIDFDNKRAYFRSKIKHQHDHHHSPVRISVRRAYILEDSYNQLRMRSPQDLKGRLTVHFQGEEGIDAGGLTREWYQLLSRVIFDKGALLFTTVGNDLTFQPNPNSVYQTEHLSYFKFVGRVVGKALFDGQLLDAHFTRSFYKHILGVKVTYHDIEAIDPAYFKNLKWMLEHDVSDVLDLTFSMDADEEKLILYEKAQVTDCELIPGGRNIRVTEENKHEYVNRVAEHRLTTAIRPQINSFMEGFNELIPQELISIFNDKELELLISGLPDIDLDDLKANTEYSGYSIASPVIQWFWEIVQGFNKEDKAQFLQFVTGTSKVPLEGFNALQGISGPQRFQIHKAYGSTDHLPSAHTCFNQLDLPEYASKEQLQQRLFLAIHEANEGFGFG